MILLRLFWEFFKTGLFAVGGGMATIPFLSAMADTTGWFTQQQLADMVGVSRNTISSIETGQFNPTAKLALILCIALDKSFEELFYF